jgi:hypothetical protein
MIVGLISHIFQKDLMDNPIIVTTAKTEKGYLTMIENIPVHTFRGGSFKRDVVNVAKTEKEGIEYHNDVVNGRK